MPPIFVMGDVHGHVEVVLGHLRDAGLLDSKDRWTGRDAVLVWIGDLVDRGPDGLGAVDLARRLEAEAAAAGGRSVGLLGNHDLLLVGASRFPATCLRSGKTFAEHHDGVGGRAVERNALGSARAAWLDRRPAFLRIERTLFVHADAPGILGWGGSLEDANRTVATALASGGAASYEALYLAMAAHHAFDGRAGAWRLDLLGRRFDVDGIVHGHTPLQKLGIERPLAPHVYQGGRAVNVDGGIYRGGPGFLWELDRVRNPE